MEPMATDLRRAIAIVALLNGIWFVVEVVMAWRLGSVSLYADAISFFGDAAIDLLLLIAAGWPAATRTGVGRLLAVVVLLPALAGLVTALDKVWTLQVPAGLPLAAIGLGALLVNLVCALILARYRLLPGGIMATAFTNARTQLIGNAAIIAAGLIMAWLWHSIWPDVVVGLVLGISYTEMAREIWRAAKAEVAPRA
jgi:Co/Zn/Cd efflux system component